jgi:hypothetical protein
VAVGGESREKTLNIGTLKTHRMGHIALNIEEYGSTDSYNTRVVWAQYKRTPDSDSD